MQSSLQRQCSINISDNQHKGAQQKIMEQHKFELLEDFQPSTGVGDRIEMQEFSTAGPGKTGGWMQHKYSTEIHPVNLMVL